MTNGNSFLIKVGLLVLVVVGFVLVGCDDGSGGDLIQDLKDGVQYHEDSAQSVTDWASDTNNQDSQAGFDKLTDTTKEACQDQTGLNPICILLGQ